MANGRPGVYDRRMRRNRLGDRFDADHAKCNGQFGRAVCDGGVLARPGVHGRTQQHDSLPRRLRRHAVLRVAGTVRREFREPVLLRGAKLRLHTVDDADLQRWTSTGGDPQDCWHIHVHTRSSPDSVRPHSGLQRMCEVKCIGSKRSNLQMQPTRRVMLTAHG